MICRYGCCRGLGGSLRLAGSAGLGGIRARGRRRPGPGGIIAQRIPVRIYEEEAPAR